MQILYKPNVRQKEEKRNRSLASRRGLLILPHILLRVGANISEWICRIAPVFSKNFAEFSRKLLIVQTIFCENFEIAAVQKYAKLVELEKCCQTHIFLQNFVLIQPRTSQPKICRIWFKFKKKGRKKVGTNIGIRLDPKCFEGHLAGGIACYKRGELPQAKASFEQGLVAESGRLRGLGGWGQQNWQILQNFCKFFANF